MIIERTDSEIVIRIPAFVKTESLQQIIDYLTYQEVTSNSKAKQSQVDLLAKEAKKGWWQNNKTRFVKWKLYLTQISYSVV